MKIKKIRGGGRIYIVNPLILYKTLKEIIPELSFRPRIYGYDYTFTGDNLELNIKTFDEEEYFMDISYEGVEDKLVDLFKQIQKELQNLSLDFDLGYYEVDGDGTPISDDVNFLPNTDEL